MKKYYTVETANGYQDCGHKHRTEEAAIKCQEKLTRYYCQHGRPSGTLCSRCGGIAKRHNTSAKWYGSKIVEIVVGE